MGKMGCPEMSVENYHSTLRKIPKSCRSHLHRGGSLKSLDFLLQSPFDILKEIVIVSMSGKKWKTFRHYSWKMHVEITISMHFLCVSSTNCGKAS